MDGLLSAPLLTEGDVVQFLTQTPGFFERHADWLAQVQLSSPHRPGVVSLTQRQLEVQRAKIRLLESQLAEAVVISQQNSAIAHKIQQWTQRLLADDAPWQPEGLAMQLQTVFDLPQVAIKLWGVHAEWAQAPFAQGVGASVRAWASDLAAPHCGSPQGLEAVQWLAHPEQAASVALVPLPSPVDGAVFGLLVLAADTPERFDAALGTEFLTQLGALAGAALSHGL